MATNTPTIGLYKVDPVADGAKTFNIDTMLNENWDKIDETVSNLQEALNETGVKIPAIYNVVGDGVHNDQPGLQGYINDSYLNGKRVVTLPTPAVRYNLDDQLLVEAKDNLTLEGEGFATLLFGVQMDRAPLKFLNCKGINVRNLAISSNDTNRVADFQGALTLYNVEDFTVDRVLVDGSAAVGIFMAKCHNGSVTRCWIRDTQADGIHHTDMSSGIQTTHNHLLRTGDDAISVVSYAGTQASTCFDIHITNNVIHNAGARGITNVGGKQITIADNTIRGTASSGILVLRDGSYNTFKPVGTIISNNQIYSVGSVTPNEGNQIGIEIGGTENVQILGNTVDGAAQRGLVTDENASVVKISNNLIQNCALAGYVIGGQYVEIYNNRAELNGEQGFLLLNLTWSMLEDNFARNNGVRYDTEPDPAKKQKYDNIFISGCTDLLIDGVTSIDDRATVILDRGMELNGCARIKISKWQIKVGTQSRPVFSGTNTDIEMDPFTQAAAPTTATFPVGLFKAGQIIHSGAESYRWDGTVWNALADVSDVAFAQNTAQSYADGKAANALALAKIYTDEQMVRPSNLIPNGSGEMDFAGWQIISGTWKTLRNAPNAALGTKGFYSDAAVASGSTIPGIITNKIPAGPGVYNLSAELLLPSSDALSNYFEVWAINAANVSTKMTSASVSAQPGDNWTRRNVDYTFPADTVAVQIRYNLRDNLAAGNRGFRNLQLTAGSGVRPLNYDESGTAYLQDSTRNVYWAGQTTGSGTGGAPYVATIPGAQESGTLPDGFTLTCVINVSNTIQGPLLKVNGCYALSILMFTSSQVYVPVGYFKPGQPVTLTKVGNYFLLRSVAITGNATAAQVLAGYTFQSAAVPEGGTGTAIADNSLFYSHTTGSSAISVAQGEILNFVTIPKLVRGLVMSTTTLTSFEETMAFTGDNYTELQFVQGSNIVKVVRTEPTASYLLVYTNLIINLGNKSAYLRKTQGGAFPPKTDLSSFDFSQPFTLRLVGKQSGGAYRVNADILYA